MKVGKTRKPRKDFPKQAKRIKPSEAVEKIKERLENVRDALDSVDIDSRVRVHKYKDGSVDGELLVKVPRGMSADDLTRDMERAMGRQSMRGFWINMGTRMVIKEDDEVYRKFRGFNDVNTHYQAGVPANWSEIPFIVRKVIIAGMEKKYGRKVDSVYLRIHWSRDGRKPRSRS
jgi:hypothetical protein